MLVDTIWRVSLLTFFIKLAATANVAITTTPTLGAGIILCDNDGITLTCHTDRSGANFTWQWSNQSVQADTITVLAKLTKILYTCVISDSSGQNIGKASITILADGSAPHVVSDNFHHYASETEGHNLTLTTLVTSDLPLSSGYPIWGVLGDRSLPSTAVVDNYTDGGILHSRLSLYNLSYFDDSGNYTNTASNKCGTSFIFVFIQVTKAPIMCDHPANVTKPLHGPVVTVEGEYLSLSCSFRGNLEFLIPSLTSYWKIDFYLPDDEKMYIFDNSIVLKLPRIIDGPIELQGHRPRMLQCQFNASTLQGVTVAVWKKNNMELHNSSDYIIIQNSNPELEDLVISTLTINSSDYLGTYICYCHYNRSLVKSSKLITSNEASKTLKRNEHGLSKVDKIGIGTGTSGGAILIIFFLALVLIILIIKRRTGSCDSVKVGEAVQETRTAADYRTFSGMPHVDQMAKLH